MYRKLYCKFCRCWNGLSQYKRLVSWKRKWRQDKWQPFLNQIRWEVNRSSKPIDRGYHLCVGSTIFQQIVEGFQTHEERSWKWNLRRIPSENEDMIEPVDLPWWYRISAENLADGGSAWVEVELERLQLGGIQSRSHLKKSAKQRTYYQTNMSFRAASFLHTLCSLFMCQTLSIIPIDRRNKFARGQLGK